MQNEVQVNRFLDASEIPLLFEKIKKYDGTKGTTFCKNIEKTAFVDLSGRYGASAQDQVKEIEALFDGTAQSIICLGGDSHFFTLIKDSNNSKQINVYESTQVVKNESHNQLGYKVMTGKDGRYNIINQDGTHGAANSPYKIHIKHEKDTKKQPDNYRCSVYSALYAAFNGDVSGDNAAHFDSLLASLNNEQDRIAKLSSNERDAVGSPLYWHDKNAELKQNKIKRFLVDCYNNDRIRNAKGDQMSVEIENFLQGKGSNYANELATLIQAELPKYAELMEERKKEKVDRTLPVLGVVDLEWIRGNKLSNRQSELNKIIDNKNLDKNTVDESKIAHQVIQHYDFLNKWLLSRLPEENAMSVRDAGGDAGDQQSGFAGTKREPYTTTPVEIKSRYRNRSNSVDIKQGPLLGFDDFKYGDNISERSIVSHKLISQLHLGGSQNNLSDSSIDSSSMGSMSGSTDDKARGGGSTRKKTAPAPAPAQTEKEKQAASLKVIQATKLIEAFQNTHHNQKKRQNVKLLNTHLTELYANLYSETSVQMALQKINSAIELIETPNEQILFLGLYREIFTQCKHIESIRKVWSDLNNQQKNNKQPDNKQQNITTNLWDANGKNKPPQNNSNNGKNGKKITFDPSITKPQQKQLDDKQNHAEINSIIKSIVNGDNNIKSMLNSIEFEDLSSYKKLNKLDDVRIALKNQLENDQDNTSNIEDIEAQLKEITNHMQPIKEDVSTSINNIINDKNSVLELQTALLRTELKASLCKDFINSQTLEMTSNKNNNIQDKIDTLSIVNNWLTMKEKQDDRYTRFQQLSSQSYNSNSTEYPKLWKANKNNSSKPSKQKDDLKRLLEDKLSEKMRIHLLPEIIIMNKKNVEHKNLMMESVMSMFQEANRRQRYSNLSDSSARIEKIRFIKQATEGLNKAQLSLSIDFQKLCHDEKINYSSKTDGTGNSLENEKGMRSMNLINYAQSIGFSQQELTASIDKAVVKALRK